MNEEEVNQMLNLRGKNGELIDVFRLHGVLFIGNTKDGEWDTSKAYTLHATHSISLDVEDFQDCISEEEVKDTFQEAFKQAVTERLI